MQQIDDKKTQARAVRENKKKLMEENKELVQEINVLMANEEKAQQR